MEVVKYLMLERTGRFGVSWAEGEETAAAAAAEDMWKELIIISEVYRLGNRSLTVNPRPTCDKSLGILIDFLR